MNPLPLAAPAGSLRGDPVRMAGRLRLMGHPERLLMLCRMDEGEVAVGELIVLAGLSQSSVSQHLAVLREEGIVCARSAGQTRYYRLIDPVVRGVIHALCDLCASGCV